MIRSLRARHRLMIAGIGVVVGTLAVAGILARRAVPSNDLPPALVEHSVPVADGTPPADGTVVNTVEPEAPP